MIIDGNEYRMLRRGDNIPAKAPGESYNDLLKRLGGGDIYITGMIGYSGSKVHTFNASYVILDGKRVITSYYSVCGSQSYKSGLAALTQAAVVTCKKCGGK